MGGSVRKPMRLDDRIGKTGLNKPLVTKGWDRDIVKEYKSGKLPILTINMTRECNLKCIYCHTDAGEKDPNELTGDEWKRVIDESVELGNEVLWIGGRGEPLLDPAFEDVVKHANSQGLTTILNTNATLLNKRRARFLYENNVSPEVKIVSFREKPYDYLAGIRGWNSYMQLGLLNLLQEGYGEIVNETDDARITRIAGMMLLAKPAYKSIPDVLKFCNKYNLTPVINEIVAAGRVIKNRNLDELRLSSGESAEVAKQGSKIMGFPLARGYSDCEIQYGMFVQNNGDLIVDRLGMSCDVCDYQGKWPIGSVRETTLKDGWKRIKDERKKNRDAINTTYDEFRSCAADRCAACPMMLQSQKDYYAVQEKCAK